MAACLQSLTSSFFSLSFTSSISPNRVQLSFPSAKPLATTSTSRKFHPLVVSASASGVALAPSIESEPEPTPEDLMKYIKSRLPGGIAAQTITGTGRRKSAIARVVLQEGTGKVFINYRSAREYLQGNPLWLQYTKIPLVLLGYETSYDVFVKAHGGGLGGQAQAICLGVARALLKLSESHRAPLRQEGLLTRDARVVERKKAGLHKARKAPQYSKR